MDAKVSSEDEPSNKVSTEDWKSGKSLEVRDGWIGADGSLGTISLGTMSLDEKLLRLVTCSLDEKLGRIPVTDGIEVDSRSLQSGGLL